MQGNCSGGAPAHALGLAASPLLRPLKPRQCLLVAPCGLLQLPAGSHALWLDGLYVRLRSESAEAPKDNATLLISAATEEAWPRRILQHSDDETRLWGSRLTLQGDGVRSGHALALLGRTRSYLEGAHASLRHAPPDARMERSPWHVYSIARAAQTTAPMWLGCNAAGTLEHAWQQRKRR